MTNLFSFKRHQRDKGASLTEAVQTAPAKNCVHPFYQLDSYTPLTNSQLELYRTLREAIPIIDAAVLKLVRLVGDFTLECEDKGKKKLLDDFVKNVRVNTSSHGLYEFIHTYFEQLLTYGTAIGEIVLSPKSRNVCALYNASLDDVELKRGDGALSVDIYKKNEHGESARVKYPDLLCLSLLEPQPGEIYGTSILKGLPFVSSILLKIFNTVGTNWERVGNVRFAVTYKPQNEAASMNASHRAKEIADEWSKAMRSTDRVCDFVSVGDVGIKVIGADNQVLDCDVPIKHILEQIIAKLSIPPFLLGISWSTTERMSSQQADILTSEIDYYRSILNPVINKICSMYLRLSGYDDDFEIVWSNINLQDETQLAQARLTNAQAQLIENGGKND